MLCNLDARACDDEGGDGADVELLRAVSAGADDIEQRRIAEVGPDLYSVPAHGRGAARDFVDGFVLGAQAGQERADLRGRGFSRHDLAHGGVGLLGTEVVAVQQ